MSEALVLEILNTHIKAFDEGSKYAKLTGQRTPCDTANWSQILVSALLNIPGLKRKKGSDLSDGSDVKGANVWDAIDTPRFNGVIPAGRILTNYESSRIIYPKIFFVLWDSKKINLKSMRRCRIWCVRPNNDINFKTITDKWYEQRNNGIIKSSNFQLHPPRNLDKNIFTNTCGNLTYPLVLEAIYLKKRFELTEYNIKNIHSGKCEFID